MTWNAVAWRLSHRDFKGRSIDGAGEDWPIDYEDLAPYYDRSSARSASAAISITWKICPTASFCRRCR